MARARSGTDWSGDAGIEVQVFPEFKVTPRINGEMSRNSRGRGRGAGQGGNYPKPAAQQGAAPADAAGSATKDPWYRKGDITPPGGSSNDDDGPDDDNVKGGLIKKVHGKAPKNSKDDGKISAQIGEFVIRKSAVKKYGAPALSAVNLGRATITINKSASKTMPAPAKSASGRRGV